MLERVAALTWNRPKLVLAVVVALAAAAAVFAHDVEHHLKAAGFTDSASEDERAVALLRDAVGFDPSPGIVVLVRARDGGRLDVASPRVRREVARLRARLARGKYVGRAVDPLAAGPAGRRLVARDGRSLVIPVHLSIQDVEDLGGVAAEDAERRARSDVLDVSIGGFATSFNEVNDQTRKDLTNSELIAFPALAVLLLLVFRGVVAASIPLLIGGLSIFGTLFVLRVASSVVDMSVFALNLATALSLGLAVDYALLMVSRYREELDRHGPSREAHRRMVLTAGRAALFSGATVAVAMAGLALLPQRFLYSIGVAGASVGLLSALMALLVVPSLIALLGARINALAVRRGPAVSDESGRWYHLARGVMHRPVAVALASAALLLATASPLLWATLTGPSSQAVPPGLPAHAANEYVEDHYPRSVTEAVTVTLRGEVADKRLAAFARNLRRIDGVAGGTPFTRASDRVAYATLALDGPALERPAQDAVDAIRAARPPNGSQVLVSGNTARFMDQKQSLVDHAPLLVAILAAATLIVLFLLTGSILLPVKTLVMNALTLGASLGILVLAFQVGLLDVPFDYPGPAAVEVTSLVFLFAVTFGLATDYAVLVVARIKEQYDRGASNEDAVAIGIARTGRVITAAAVMIAVVFLAFAVSPVFFMKQIAVGMAAGVLIDATIVRALLVPSLMRLFGRWNWWAPAPLQRFQQRWGYHETEPAEAVP
ncbi:MAG TPA: MMPL family transporter [Thermoleophilaceae bacterium]